ncbi:phage tail protein, partial [Asaia sp. W19]
MKKTDFSPQFPTVWGAGADSTHLQYPIPGTSNALGRASLNLGFPPATFVAPEAGGSFMFGEDMNGALRMLATAAQNYESGVFPPFSAAFAQAV